MEPLLLLLSLFITHLAVGGELPQYSTATVYVSANGTDSSGCLNGDHHCKTLGYVLTNMPMLHCSNCTVMVTYDHVVGLFNDSHTVDISNLDVLHITGVGRRHCLSFNGSGLLLVNADNATSVTLENIELSNCQSDQFSSCFITDGYQNDFIGYYLLNFEMINVVVRQSHPFSLVVKSILCFSSAFINSNTDVGLNIKLYKPDSDVTIFNTTFHNLQYASVVINIELIMHSHYNLSKSINISVRECRFNYIDALSSIIQVSINDNNYWIDLYVDKCWYDNSTSLFLYVTNSDNVTTTNGNVLITNTHFSNVISGQLLLFQYVFVKLESFNSNISVTFKRNTVNNTIFDTLAEFQNWGLAEIENSMFTNNQVNKYLVSFSEPEDTGCHGTVNILIHNVLFFENSLTSMATADKGAIVALQNYNCNHYSMALCNVSFTSNIGTPLSLINIKYLTVIGTIRFYSNNAITGGGIYISSGDYGSTALNIASNVTIVFQDNVVMYGGAIYIDQAIDCFLGEYYDTSFDFGTNQAVYGPQIFSSHDWCSFSHNTVCGTLQHVITERNIMSVPSAMMFNNDNSTTIFPGQTIVGDMTIIDCFGRTSSCVADVYLDCGNKICVGYNIIGPSTAFLTNGSVNTQVKLKFLNSSKQSLNSPQLNLICRTPIKQLSYALTLTVNITVATSCPIGLSFSAPSGQCKCNKIDNNFVCSDDIGVSCVRRGLLVQPEPERKLVSVSTHTATTTDHYALPM